MTSVPKVIDVEVALQEKIPDIYKKFPAVILRLIKKVIRQDDINRMIHESSHLHGIPLVDWVLDQFGVDICHQGEGMDTKKWAVYFFSKSSPGQPGWSRHNNNGCNNPSVSKVRCQ